eukprot:5941285-Amphidinium_carterae.1
MVKLRVQEVHEWGLAEPFSKQQDHKEAPPLKNTCRANPNHKYCTTRSKVTELIQTTLQSLKGGLKHFHMDFTETESCKHDQQLYSLGNLDKLRESGNNQANEKS